MRQMKYGYDTFAICNKKNKCYGCAEMRIESVDFSKGTCEVYRYGHVRQPGYTETYQIKDLVEQYLTATEHMTYITNPSALKRWGGFVNAGQQSGLPAREMYIVVAPQPLAKNTDYVHIDSIWTSELKAQRQCKRLNADTKYRNEHGYCEFYVDHKPISR